MRRRRAWSRAWSEPATACRAHAAHPSAPWKVGESAPVVSMTSRVTPVAALLRVSVVVAGGGGDPSLAGFAVVRARSVAGSPRASTPITTTMKRVSGTRGVALHLGVQTSKTSEAG